MAGRSGMGAGTRRTHTSAIAARLDLAPGKHAIPSSAACGSGKQPQAPAAAHIRRHRVLSRRGWAAAHLFHQRSVCQSLSLCHLQRGVKPVHGGICEGGQGRQSSTTGAASEAAQVEGSMRVHACVGAAASAGCARCAPPAPPASSAAASRARRGRRGGGGPGERTPQAQHRRWDVQPAGRKPGAARSTHWWQQTGCCSDTSWKRRASCPQPAGPAARAADQGVADAERGCARRQAAHLPATGCLLAGLTSMICWNLVSPSFAAAQAQAHIQRRIEGSRGRRRRAR